MRKPEPIRPRLLQPPKRQVATFPGMGSVSMGEGPRKGTPRRAIPTSVASGARLLMDLSLPTIPPSVVGSRRTVAPRTSLLSPLIPRRSPGRNQAVEIPLRWLI